MRFTSACVHALRALTYLARHQGEGFVPAAEAIAGAEGLSGTFVRKTLTALTRGRVVLASRGSRRGGYRLARPARRITLLEVVEAVEGPVRGLAPRFAAGDGARLDARLQEVCERVAESVRRRLRRVTVADLADEGE
jgi:Rrf2 family protein